MPHSPLLGPLLSLILWSLVMLIWAGIGRVPRLMKLGRPDPELPQSELLRQLPGKARWPGENYNNLMEQPTLFYALIFALILIREDTAMNLALAWAYVGLRILHSLIQASLNVVLVRFSVFTLATLVLIAMAVNAFLAYSAG